MVNTDAAKLMRIKAEEVLDRGTAASRSAGELAGRFAAMLEQLNGVNGAEGTEVAGLNATSATGPLPTERGVALGAVSVFAQSAEDMGAESPTTADGAEAVVEHTLGTSTPLNVRWLTTLFTQSGA